MLNTLQRIINSYKFHSSKRKLIKQFLEFQSQEINSNKRFLLNKNEINPIIGENINETEFDRHYIYHPAWAARILKNNNPEIHVDISSTLHFSSLVSAFIKVDFYDFRPVKLELSNFNSSFADVTNLDFKSNSILSLSCMHTIEHIGLGRYGDKLDYNGDLKAIKELSRVLKEGGCLLIVVPIAKESKVYFNSHRVYSKKLILDLFKTEGVFLQEFALIPDSISDGGLIINPSDEILEKQKYGCGCFWFTK